MFHNIHVCPVLCQALVVLNGLLYIDVFNRVYYHACEGSEGRMGSILAFQPVSTFQCIRMLQSCIQVHFEAILMCNAVSCRVEGEDILRF